MFRTYYGVVHPWLCDVMGHLTTRYYVGMFDDSHWHFFTELGINQDEMLKRGEGFADVKSTLEYKAELHSGALVYIDSTLISLGGKSFVHRHEMYNRSTGELAATMENITVTFDLNARKAVPLFDHFRKSAEQYLTNPDSM
jgi:acyl-CoA thioester hydrolase